MATDLMNCSVLAAVNPIVFAGFGQYKPAGTRVAFVLGGIFGAQTILRLS